MQETEGLFKKMTHERISACTGRPIRDERRGLDGGEERGARSSELGEMRRRRHCRRLGARRSGPNRRYGARFSKLRAPG
jgi:hypothetical protein